LKVNRRYGEIFRPHLQHGGITQVRNQNEADSKMGLPVTCLRRLDQPRNRHEAGTMNLLSEGDVFLRNARQLLTNYTLRYIAEDVTLAGEIRSASKMRVFPNF
jgi:hypothetical protein